MKNRVLLTGANNTIIDEFFLQMDEVFEVQFSSTRYEDLLCHANYFKPDLFVYCMDAESRETISRMIPIKNKFSRMGIPFVIIGTKEDCSDFFKMTAGIEDLALEKPITAKKIQEKLTNYLHSLGRAKEEAKLKQRVEEEKKRLAEEEKAQKDNEIMQILVDLEEANHKKHVLVVDDDVRMLKVIKEHLHLEYDVATAINGKLALKFLENKTTDLILLDYVMPGEDGPTVLSKIHENPATKDIPVIFLTGMMEKGKIQEALSERPQGYLLKPIEREKLLSTIESVLK